MMPLVGEKVWFGPRRFGWGLDPVSPEGWAVVVTFAAAAAAVLAKARGRRGWWSSRWAGLLLLAIAIAKGTAPGGPRRAREFRAARGEAARHAEAA